MACGPALPSVTSGLSSGSMPMTSALLPASRKALAIPEAVPPVPKPANTRSTSGRSLSISLPVPVRWAAVLAGLSNWPQMNPPYSLAISFAMSTDPCMPFAPGERTTSAP